MGDSRRSRREFIKTSIALVVGASIASILPRLGTESDTSIDSSLYYEDFVPDPEIDGEEFILYYEALGLIVENRDGEKCLANPLLGDKCIRYFRPYTPNKYLVLPPGADPETFYSKCIRCGLCYYACIRAGYNAIRLKSIGEDGLFRAGTPVVYNQLEYPCTLCMECTKVCPTDALEEVEEKDVRMGIALIDPDLCWGWNSDYCISCAKACPFASEVFEFSYSEWGTHPYVRPDKCTGCGLCIPACPVVGSAIHVLPRQVYSESISDFKELGLEYRDYLELIRRVEDEDPGAAVLRVSINIHYLLERRRAKPPED